MELKDYIKDIPDFPSKGILFRDITPLLQDKDAYKYAIDQLGQYAKEKGVELVVGPESRGFIVGCPLAYSMNVGFAPVRKPGKLPRATVSCKYTLEYGQSEVFMHADAVKKGQKVLIVDDLLATGGTAQATCKIVEEMGGEVVGIAFFIELEALKGRELLKDYDVFSLMKY